MAGAVITSCNNEKDGPDSEVEGNVQIKLYDASVTTTRAYTAEEPAVQGETELADRIAVFVYDDSGTLEYQNLSLPVDAQGVTQTFKVGTGFKYFYIFSNGQMKGADAGSNWDELEKQVAEVQFRENVPIPIAENARMVIGTLWRGDTGDDRGNRRHIVGNGYGGEPVKVGLTVGRATAKIRLNAVNKETTRTSPLLGAFGDHSYILRSVADRYYVVGQLDDSGDYPPELGLRYISAVHDKTPGTTALPADAFYDYKWEWARTLATGQHFYAVENTTMRQPSANQPANLFYGNTTFVQLKTQYTPTLAETLNPDGTPATTALATGDTFYSGILNGQTFIYNDTPTVAGVSDIKEYENGYMFYKFPVRDRTESGTDAQCCVIRNHYYEITVENIMALGEPTDEVDPETPIDPNDPDIEINVTVAPWFKVTQGETLE